MLAGVVSAQPAAEGSRERRAARHALLVSARRAYDAGLSSARWLEREAPLWAVELAGELDVAAVIAMAWRGW